MTRFLCAIALAFWEYRRLVNVAGLPLGRLYLDYGLRQARRAAVLVWSGRLERTIA